MAIMPTLLHQSVESVSHQHLYLLFNHLEHHCMYLSQVDKEWAQTYGEGVCFEEQWPPSVLICLGMTPVNYTLT